MSFAKNIWAGLQVVLIEHYIQFSLSTLTTYNSGLEKTNGVLKPQNIVEQ